MSISLITLCPIGSVDPRILDHLAERISAKCNLDCRISPELENPRYAYNEARGQYNSKVILQKLIPSCSSDTVRFVGVLNLDLYVPILKYVFGLAEVGGQCALISTYRLRPEFYDQPGNLTLLLERTEKTALHELGHTLGLTHCRDRLCVMYSSTHIENTDQKKADFCRTCRELFVWYLDKKRARPHG